MVWTTIALVWSAAGVRKSASNTTATGTCVEPITSDSTNAAPSTRHKPTNTAASRRAWPEACIAGSSAIVRGGWAWVTIECAQRAGTCMYH